VPHLDIPVIDIAPFLDGTPAIKADVAVEVARACEEIGFLTVVGHGARESLTGRMYDVSREFFDLPLEEKLRSRAPDPS
jgi:isopenicillin N synthase-like dioxygenase